MRFKLSLRNVAEMMAERGLQRAHTTIIRWVQQPTYPSLIRGDPPRFRVPPCFAGMKILSASKKPTAAWKSPDDMMQGVACVAGPRESQGSGMALVQTHGASICACAGIFGFKLSLRDLVEMMAERGSSLRRLRACRHQCQVQKSRYRPAQRPASLPAIAIRTEVNSPNLDVEPYTRAVNDRRRIIGRPPIIRRGIWRAVDHGWRAVIPTVPATIMVTMSVPTPIGVGRSDESSEANIAESTSPAPSLASRRRSELVLMFQAMATSINERLRYGRAARPSAG